MPFLIIFHFVAAKVPHDLFPCQSVRAGIIVGRNILASTGSLSNQGSYSQTGREKGWLIPGTANSHK